MYVECPSIQQYLYHELIKQNSIVSKKKLKIELFISRSFCLICLRMISKFLERTL